MKYDVLIEQEVRTLKQALELHKKEIECANECRELALDNAKRLDDETKAHGISYDKERVTSSINVTPYVNELIILQASYEIEEKHHRQNAYEIRKKYKISERLKKLNENEKKYIKDIYFDCKSIAEMSRIKKTSKNYVSVYLNKCIRKMAGADE